MNKRFRPCSLDQFYLLPPSLHDWLPAGHLASELLTDCGVIVPPEAMHRWKKEKTT